MSSCSTGADSAQRHSTVLLLTVSASKLPTAQTKREDRPGPHAGFSNFGTKKSSVKSDRKKNFTYCGCLESGDTAIYRRRGSILILPAICHPDYSTTYTQCLRSSASFRPYHCQGYEWRFRARRVEGSGLKYNITSQGLELAGGWKEMGRRRIRKASVIAHGLHLHIGDCRCHRNTESQRLRVGGMRTGISDAKRGVQCNGKPHITSTKTSSGMHMEEKETGTVSHCTLPLHIRSREHRIPMAANRIFGVEEWDVTEDFGLEERSAMQWNTT